MGKKKLNEIIQWMVIDYTWHGFIYFYYNNIHSECRDAVVQEKNKTKKEEDDKRFLEKNVVLFSLFIINSAIAMIQYNYVIHFPKF